MSTTTDHPSWAVYLVFFLNLDCPQIAQRNLSPFESGGDDQVARPLSCFLTQIVHGYLREL